MTLSTLRGQAPIAKSSISVHPISIFVGTWTATFGLYALKLSGQLIFEASDFLYLYVAIISGFLGGYWYVGRLSRLLAGPSGARPHSYEFTNRDIDQRVWNRMCGLLQIWAIATIVETIVSGGLPIVWLLTGNQKNYQDFGIPSVHGFLISMLLAVAMVSYYLFLETKRRRYLLIPAFSLFWFVVSITRAYFVAQCLEMLFLYLAKRPPTVRQIIKVIGGAICLIVIFGALGDFRTGGTDLIRAIGEPTARYPSWLPTGFLWAYIYLATPLNNLFNTVQLHPMTDSFGLVNTTYQLFPTFIRDLVFPNALQTQGDLVSANLNVSTSFVPPYLDMGLLGVAICSFLFGAIAGLFWSRRRDSFFLLGYAFVAQAMALSIFFDFLLYLPFLFQLVWFWYLLAPQRALRAPAGARESDAQIGARPGGYG